MQPFDNFEFWYYLKGFFSHCHERRSFILIKLLSETLSGKEKEGHFVTKEKIRRFRPKDGNLDDFGRTIHWTNFSNFTHPVSLGLQDELKRFSNLIFLNLG